VLPREVPLITIVLLDHRTPPVAEQIVEVEQAGYRVEADLTGYEGMAGLHDEVDDVVTLDLTMLGAVDDDRVVGVLGYHRHGNLVDVDRLAVHPAHFRRGIGRALLEDLHRREADAQRIERVLREQQPTESTRVFAIVSVGRDGHARLKGLLVDGERLELRWL